MSILNKIVNTKTTKKSDENKKESAVAVVAQEFKKNRLSVDKIGLIVQEPVVTEKTSHLMEINKYVFKVASKATKNEIKKAIEGLYGVNVIGVNVLRTAIKPRRIGKNIVDKGAFKKAMVAIKSGESIKEIKN